MYQVASKKTQGGVIAVAIFGVIPVLLTPVFLSAVGVIAVTSKCVTSHKALAAARPAAAKGLA